MSQAAQPIAMLNIERLDICKVWRIFRGFPLLIRSIRLVRGCCFKPALLTTVCVIQLNRECIEWISPTKIHSHLVWTYDCGTQSRAWFLSEIYSVYEYIQTFDQHTCTACRVDALVCDECMVRPCVERRCVRIVDTSMYYNCVRFGVCVCVWNEER